ncbi:hypothetical protein DFA_00004 [Cavenderia fasciculata]|uniref:CUE domain-containing protein n=1 Tax=Cavenderia fasciculata TaxID=261658 RepID=F4PXB7_CACFS|nr:uncharacterized protein DFA_00004 [Cavenderia fasciculata]EGG19427.1 hypothetical protein DFA_00004 [Cavenderia fasciculata]|eukprot:XP_004357721.1 hypothetical protein DFA_00004 [Cavenderia fasciculata]
MDVTESTNTDEETSSKEQQQPISPPKTSQFALPSTNYNINDNSNNNNNSNSNANNNTTNNRYTPYRQGDNLSFKDRLELIEQVVSMYPLLEKDNMVYSILNRNNWSVERSLTELQKRHDYQEKLDREKKKLSPTGAATLSSSIVLDTSGEMSESSMTNDESHEEEMEEEPSDEFEEEEEEEMEGNVDPQQQFPKIIEDIQTLKDIFGSAYHDFELKAYYMMCGGNLELIIDQLVTEQNNIAKKSSAGTGGGGVAGVVDPLLKNDSNVVQPTEVRHPITSRLTEQEKRQLQLQLIQEQESLEKKFEDKKKHEIASHPNKKSYSKDDILKELKDLFKSTVEEGVIEWVAYNCQYDLGAAVTQLVDLKHNNLMNKSALPTMYQPHLDPTITANLANGFNALKGIATPQQTVDTTQPTHLTSQNSNESMSFIIDKVTTLSSNDKDNDNNNNNNNNKTVFSPWGSPTSEQQTTTTTTTTANNPTTHQQ